MTLTRQQLLSFLPLIPDADAWASALAPACERFGITSTDRIAAFLAQVAHESAEFRRLEESLNY